MNQIGTDLEFLNEAHEFMLSIDPSLFDESAISHETREFNAKVVDLLSNAPDMWAKPASEIRRLRLEGGGPFPLEPEEPSATMLEVDAKHGAIPVRCFQPRKGKSEGTYLHIHGGGWVIGSCTAHDVRLQEIADNCRLTCLSVDYRLAPEHPYPCGPDDCEEVAVWLSGNSHDFNTSYLAIGGESAGAHLAVVTLLRLRDKHDLPPFHAANLTAGVYDLGQTPSAKNWGNEKLILNSRDMQLFAARYTQGMKDLRDGDVSPLYARLDDLPPALFSVGTKDLLLDDTLMMATLWNAANGNVSLDITPGGCHVFQSFRDLVIAKESNLKIDRFLREKKTQS